MLPSELLLPHRRGAQVYPRFLRREHLPWAEQVLALISEHQHVAVANCSECCALEGDSTRLPDRALLPIWR